MTQAEVKAELQRIHGATNSPNDWTFNKAAGTIFGLMDSDESKVEALRADLADLDSDSGIEGVYQAVRLALLAVAPEPEPEPEEG